MNDFVENKYIEQELKVLNKWVDQNPYIKDIFISSKKNNEENINTII